MNKANTRSYVIHASPKPSAFLGETALPSRILRFGEEIEDVLTYMKESHSKSVKGVRGHRLIPPDGNQKNWSA